MRRAFAVMGMHPAGYYDLAAAEVPVHSPAFRPIHRHSLNRSPSRVFTSLLRLEPTADEELRAMVRSILAQRRIFSEEAESLILRHERQGGHARHRRGAGEDGPTGHLREVCDRRAAAPPRLYPPAAGKL